MLDSAIIKDDVIIGDGSLVLPGKRLESGYLYLDSPVRQVHTLNEQEIAGLLYSANNYVRWKDDYLAEASQTHS